MISTGHGFYVWIVYMFPLCDQFNLFLLWVWSRYFIFITFLNIITIIIGLKSIQLWDEKKMIFAWFCKNKTRSPMNIKKSVCSKLILNLLKAKIVIMKCMIGTHAVAILSSLKHFEDIYKIILKISTFCQVSIDINTFCGDVLWL